MLQNYLSQLITDMHEAKLRVPVSKVPEGVFDPDYRDELEASPDRRMSEWFGLETELFPLSEMLTAEELKLMADEFEELWGAYSFLPEFPDGLPDKRRYELLREYLDYSCQHWPGGWIHHFTFCDNEPDKCPFGIELCQCKNLSVDDLN